MIFRYLITKDFLGTCTNYQIHIFQRALSAASTPILTSKYAFSAFFEIYKILTPSHRSEVIFLLKKLSMLALASP